MSIHADMPLAPRARAERSVSALIAVWLAAVAAGWWYVERYEFSVNEPSSQGIVTQWPAESALVRSENRPTLLLFLHPKCPCSRATLNELNRLLTATTGTKRPAPELLVVATVPPTANEAWWDTDTTAHAQQIAQAKVFVDRGGREAARFGASTSGFLMLFDEFGSRRYAGGITISRGHEGRSAERDRLAELLSGKTSEPIEMPVFGCRLCLPELDVHDEAAADNRHQLTKSSS